MSADIVDRKRTKRERQWGCTGGVFSKRERSEFFFSKMESLIGRKIVRLI